jgi:hypothetical protein
LKSSKSLKEDIDGMDGVPGYRWHGWGTRVLKNLLKVFFSLQNMKWKQNSVGMEENKPLCNTPYSQEHNGTNSRKGQSHSPDSPAPAFKLKQCNMIRKLEAILGIANVCTCHRDFQNIHSTTNKY